MLPPDNAYTAMKKHKLPLTKNNEPITEFLSCYYDEYNNDLNTAISSKDKRFLQDGFYNKLSNLLPLIKESCDSIIKLLELYNGANLKKIYEHLSISMDKIKCYLYTQTIPRENYNFYRIRPSDNGEFNRKELFHIPMNKRHMIKPYRYSIAGYPCLYLSTGIDLCWFECGMPKKFSISQFSFDPTDNTNVISLIDFTYDPIDLYSRIVPTYYNKPNDKDKIDDYILKHFVSHPLRAACSIIANNRNTPFIEEYILPQLLLLWVRESNEYNGVIYSSASSIEEATRLNYYNIVLPAKDLGVEYCSYLKQIFKVSKPIKCDVGTIFKSYSSKIDKVRKYTKELERINMHGNPQYLHREILSTCKSFLLFYDCISSENYSDPEPLYQIMDTINLLAYVINDNKKMFSDIAVQKGTGFDPYQSEKDIEADFDHVVNHFTNEIKPILFDFWGYALRVSCDINIDQSTYKYI